METAQQPVELEQAGGDAGELADAMVCSLGCDGGLGERSPEGLEAAFGLTRRGELVELLLRDLDLLQCRLVDVAAERAVDHAFAEIDELAAEIEVVDHPAEGRGIDHMDGGGGEPGEVGRAARRLHRLVALDIGLERDGAHHLAALDQARQRIVELAMQRVGKMLRPQEFGHALIGGVIDQDGAEQRLLRLEIMRRLPQTHVVRPGEACDVRVFEGLHAEPSMRRGRPVPSHKRTGLWKPGKTPGAGHSAANECAMAPRSVSTM